MSKTYMTVQGDMWDNIAYSQLGSVSYTDQLMHLNPQYLEYYAFPGIPLVLPDAVPPALTTLPPWKEVAG